MTTKATLIVVVIILLATIGMSLYAYPRLPERAATHWNAQGEANGYSTPLAAAGLLPLIMAGTLLLLLAVPRIDPLKANIQLFLKDYNLLIAFTGLFMMYVHLLTILWNLGVQINMNISLVPAFGLLMFFMGVLVSKARRNYMIGIRTPWTLANDTVWDKTHALGGKLFKAAGILALLGFFFPSQAFLFLMVPVLTVTLVLVVYSYLEFRRQEGRQ